MIEQLLTPLLLGLAGAVPHPCAPIEPRPPASVDDLEPEWRQGPLQESLAAASDADRLVFVYFWSNDSQHCATMWNTTLDTPTGRATVLPYVCHSAPIAAGETPELLSRYCVGVLPTVLVLDASGDLQDGMIGVMPPGEFAQQMQRIAAGTDTLGDLAARCAAAPDDLDLHYARALKLEYLGQLEAAEAVFADIRRADPRGRTLVGARLQLLDVQRTIAAAAADPGDLATFDPAPMADLLRGLRHDPVRFDGWLWISQVHEARGDEPAYRKALAEAWPLAAPEQQLDFGTQLAFAFWDSAEDLTSAERRLAQRAASAAALAAEEALTKFAQEVDEEPEDQDGDGARPKPEGLGLEAQAEAKRGFARAFAALACAERLLRHDAASRSAMERAIELDPANLEFRTLAGELLDD